MTIADTIYKVIRDRAWRNGALQELIAEAQQGRLATEYIEPKWVKENIGDKDGRYNTKRNE